MPPPPGNPLFLLIMPLLRTRRSLVYAQVILLPISLSILPLMDGCCLMIKARAIVLIPVVLERGNGWLAGLLLFEAPHRPIVRSLGSAQAQ